MAADECITKVARHRHGRPQAVRCENAGLPTQMIAELEARLAETAETSRRSR
ncbi:hypothetical protein [Nonomuraea sp. NPDC003709]|uniref:hypothetical protein n=1 Tax=Nonomuraea sp. NPDC003709 TaxID=3154450 RepID=UPI0033ACED00